MAVRKKLLKKKKKRKRTRKTVGEKRAIANEVTSEWRPVEAYLQRLHELENQPKATRMFVESEHVRLLGVAPKAGTHPEVAKARVGYKLQYDGFVEAGKEDELTEGFLRNYEAAMSMRKDTRGFDETMVTLLNIDTSQTDPDGEGGSAGKKKKKKKKKDGQTPRDKGPTITSLIYELYWKNGEAKLSDEEIQKIALEKFPEGLAYKRIANVSRMRRRLNLGRVKAYGKPDTPIERYVDGKVVKGKLPSKAVLFKKVKKTKKA